MVSSNELIQVLQVHQSQFGTNESSVGVCGGWGGRGGGGMGWGGGVGVGVG